MQTKSYNSDCLLIKGSNYECGASLGRLFKRQIPARLSRLGIDDNLISKKRRELEIALSFHETKHEKLVDEIRGIADGSEQDFWKIFILNCPHISDNEHGCTSIIMENDGQILLGHNEDGINGEEADDTQLIQFALPNLKFHSFVYAGELAGSSYSWNEHHFFFTTDTVPAYETDLRKVSKFFAARILTESNSIENALSQLEILESAGGYHFYLGSGNNIFSVEQYPDALDVLQVRRTWHHTNHYIHRQPPIFLSGSPNSLMRYLKAERYLKADRPILEILFDRESEPECIYSEGYKRRTLSTVIFDPQANLVSVFDKLSSKESKTFEL